MNCKLTRTDYSEYGIFGELRNEAGDFIAVTLEHAFPFTDSPAAGEVSYEPKIPAGTYICQRHAPNRLPYETFELQNVPGSTGDLIHIGNYNKDSIGCILVGQSRLRTYRNEMILASKETFEKFMEMQKGVSEFTLTIE